MPLRVTPLVGLLLAAGCGGSSLGLALQTNGCGNPDQGFVLGTMTLTNHGGSSVKVPDPTFYRGLKLYSSTGALLREDPPPTSQTDTSVRGSIEIAAGGSWSTGIPVWDKRTASAPAPDGIYGLAIDLTNGPTAETQWVTLPSCAPTTRTP